MTTSPITFTVQVSFKGITYDAKIIPLKNGEDAPLTQEHADLLRRAETTNQLFSKKIEEMLAGIEGYSEETHGTLQAASSTGFTFEKQPIVHKTDKLWNDFVNKFYQSAEHIPVKKEPAPAGRPVGPPADPLVGPEVRVEFKPNIYTNLTTEEQRKARLGLFTKKCWEHFRAQGADIPANHQPEACTPEELSYLELITPSEKTLSSDDQLWLICGRSVSDRIEMARILDEIKAQLQL